MNEHEKSRNSQKTPIARPHGRAMGVYSDEYIGENELYCKWITTEVNSIYLLAPGQIKR